MLKQKERRFAACWIIAYIALGTTFTANAQQQPYHRCGTMQALEKIWQQQPELKDSMTKASRIVQQAARQQQSRVDAGTIYIPVVFHIVHTDPAVVTDAQIQEQLAVLNNDFGGLNADSADIPPAFKPLFGKSDIQFVLAKRTPGNQPTTGIERYTTTKNAFSIFDDDVKLRNTGGAGAWDPSRYLNIWVCNLSGGILGYATFPGSGSASRQGVVILYSALPGGAAAPYNKGRTLTHEAGHYFFLYHIWGDDNGGCGGTDYIDDTPPQGDATAGCPGGGVLTDACSSVAPGIMYQNYMDYTNDACMLMFTSQQAARMKAALDIYRSSLQSSNAAVSPLEELDAGIGSIDYPVGRVCGAVMTPVITLRNEGLRTLTSARIYASLDNGAAVVTNWTGSLTSTAGISVALSNMTVTTTSHSLKVWVSAPNDSTDMKAANDTLTTVFEYNLPLTPPLAESFEGNSFPPESWDIVNPDGSVTWERVSGVSKTGKAAMVIRNFGYEQTGQRDYIRLPEMHITNADSAFLTFQVAAAAKAPGSILTVWDTLQVLASTDCGQSYTSLYKKWGNALVTRNGAVTTSFIPAAGEWRKDSVDLTAYINAGPVMLAFANTPASGNNIYIDDVNLYKTVISPVLKEKGWLVTPSPTSGQLAVQFYPNPSGLRGIAIYNSAGQKVAEKRITGAAASGYYSFDISRFANGVYIVQVLFDDRKMTQKIIKRG